MVVPEYPPTNEDNGYGQEIDSNPSHGGNELDLKPPDADNQTQDE